MTPPYNDVFLQPDLQWDPGPPLQGRFLQTIVAALEHEEPALESEESRMELDSHANMPVVGRNAYVLSDTGRRTLVGAYHPDLEPQRLKIVDAAVLYQDGYTGIEYILVVRNALHVPSMNHNLIPPFILRENGIKVNEIAKIHCDEPSKEDHAIVIDSTLRIPLSLHGVFSYFPTRLPTVEELQASDNVYMLTPENFDPHDGSFAHNESRMVDWEGEVSHKEDCRRIMLEDVPDTSDVIASARAIRQEEQEHIDRNLIVPDRSSNQAFRSEIADVSAVLCEMSLCDRLIARNEVSQMMCSIGFCDATEDATLFGDIPPSPDDTIDIEDLDDEMIVDHIFAAVSSGQLDLEELPFKDDKQVSSAFARPKEGLDAQHLSRVWQIDLPTARRTLEVTTQHHVQSDDPKLARNYGTGDRILRYKRIQKYFFMDTFFAAKKHGLSSRKNSCCQFFCDGNGICLCCPDEVKVRGVGCGEAVCKRNWSA